MTLNTITRQDEVDEILAPSKKYAPSMYAEVLTALAKAPKKVKGAERIEESFPGVKPAHVAHMLKKLLADDQTVQVTITATRGVCAVRVAA